MTGEWRQRIDEILQVLSNIQFKLLSSKEYHLCWPLYVLGAARACVFIRHSNVRSLRLFLGQIKSKSFILVC